MPIEILMPALSPTMTEGNLAKWHKKEGDKVAPGDVVAEIETDKATMEVEAVDEGTIGKILVQEGAQGVAVNTPIAVLLEEGDASDSVVLSAAKDLKPSVSVDVPKKGESSVAALPQNDRVSGAASATKTTGSRIFASPLAKRLAAENGIDLATVSGSGPHGRVVRADVEGYKISSSVGTAAPSYAHPPAEGAVARAKAGEGGVTKIPNNNIRKIAAKRLLESKQSIPHFYLTVDFRIDGLLEARQQINAQANGAFKLSVNDFIVKACANALIAYPAANVSWTDEAILQYAQADISVAVSTENGLITPIVRAAETKGLRQISDEVKDLAARARENKLRPEEFQGGTFTVSNLGMYGIREFGAIINPPQACILAVGAGEQRPYAEDGQVKIGTFMTCTLSVDHRAVDGAVGAEYLQVLKGYIESPVSMLV